MTNEEKALTYFKDLRARKLKDYSSVFDIAPKDSLVYETASAEIEIYNVAIQALEQEDVLGKVRAEIEQITDTMGVSYNQYVSKIDVLHIIDKYREEDAK